MSGNGRGPRRDRPFVGAMRPSGGQWIAIAVWDHRDDVDGTRIWRVEERANGDDVTASAFWDAPPSWVAVGATPDAALAALYAAAGG